MEPADSERFDALVAKVDLLERQMAVVLGQLGQLGAAARGHVEPLDDVEQLIAKGDRIAAIKRHREKTNASLAEARRYVEDLAARRGL